MTFPVSRAAGSVMLALVVACTGSVGTANSSTSSVGPAASTTSTHAPPPESPRERVEAALGTEIPEGAWSDWTTAMCADRVDANALVTAADDLVVWAGGGEPALSENTLLTAQALWHEASQACPGQLAGDAVGGPPEVFEYPSCDLREPVTLPWSESVGEPDESHHQGVVEAVWREPASQVSEDGAGTREEMRILVGRGKLFADIVDQGRPAGDVAGARAFVAETVDADGNAVVEIAWALSGRWCDATVVSLAPDPRDDPRSDVADAGDIVRLVESLMFPQPGSGLNEAELIILGALDRIEGVTSVGGEPAHGGPDASVGFSHSGDEYWIYAAPTEFDAEYWDLVEPLTTATIGDVEISIYEVAEAEDSLVAVFERAGLLVHLQGLTASEGRLSHIAVELAEAIDSVERP